MNRRILKRVFAVVGILALAVASLLAYSSIRNDSANRSAVQFCREVQAGSNISSAIASAKAAHLMFGGPNETSEYFFVFPGFGMDKAICNVVVEQGIVRRTYAGMSYD